MRKLLERIENKIQLRLLHENSQHMVLFHGSPKKFDTFKTPTGLSKMDVTKGGVVYLTSDYNSAAKYAGKGGFVYTIKAKNAISYKEQRQKQGLPPKARKYIRDVFIALPENCKVIGRSEA